jgi:hypothetical protein
VIELTAETLRPFYVRLFRSCLEAEQTGERTPQHEYECSSADVFREFVMTLYPLRERQGLLVVNSIVVETPHDPALRPPHACDRTAYVQENGWIHQCVHCRRVENVQTEGRWDWVPEWVEAFPPETSHGLCTFCHSHYYPR